MALPLPLVPGAAELSCGVLRPPRPRFCLVHSCWNACPSPGAPPVHTPALLRLFRKHFRHGPHGPSVSPLHFLPRAQFYRDERLRTCRSHLSIEIERCWGLVQGHLNTGVSGPVHNSELRVRDLRAAPVIQGGPEAHAGVHLLQELDHLVLDAPIATVLDGDCVLTAVERQVNLVVRAYGLVINSDERMIVMRCLEGEAASVLQ
mmetsp:Transcript_44571/g.72576  ORF Transcript_44571/g.72576 Transcript_44571/m.72576 type:complete len:204 (+) Transcript_44571:580-1191(+)